MFAKGYTAFGLGLLILVFQGCIRFGNCKDGIKNQRESGVDCGGPCQACGTCFDGIQNRDETNIDCGGLGCKPCPSCNDGIKNQDETNVDCGGVCGKCPIIFPNNSFAGFNILRLFPVDTGLFLNRAAISAELPENTTLEIKMTDLSTLSAVSWTVVNNFENDWQAFPPENNTQRFYIKGPSMATISLDFGFNTFGGVRREARIEYFVNGETTPRFTKLIGWRTF